MSMPRAVVVVLAAGRGSRFEGHGHKLAQPFGDHDVLDTCVANALASALEVVLVTTDRFRDSRAARLAHRLVLLPDAGSGDTPGSGMGASIAAAVRATPNADGWLILPGDMPLVRPDTIVRVAHALNQADTARPTHDGTPGHPVAFAHCHYDALEALSGDVGARRILRKHPPVLIAADDDPGVLADIDTLADLERLHPSRTAAGEASFGPAGTDSRATKAPGQGN